MDSGLRARRCELSTRDTALLLAGHAVLPELVRSGERRRSADPAAGRRHLCARGLDLGSAAPAAGRAGLAAGQTDSTGSTGAATTSDGRLPAGAGRAGARGRRIGVARLVLDVRQVVGHVSGYEHLGFPPLFGHQYSHIWTDFRGIADPYNARAGIDYFENSRRATYSQQAYAIANPGGWKGYDDRVWGLTACDGPYEGPGTTRAPRAGSGAMRPAAPGCYARSTTARSRPTAMVSSLPFTPEIGCPRSGDGPPATAR